MAKGYFRAARPSYFPRFFALLLGAWLGLSPAIFTLQTGLILLCFVFLRLPWLSFIGAALVCWGLGMVLLDPLLSRIGEFLLTEPSLAGLWSTFYNVPLLPWTRFNNSMVLGAFALGLCLIPLWAAFAWRFRRA